MLNKAQVNLKVLTCLCLIHPCLHTCSSEFKQVKELGRGGFSIVFRATHRIDGCEYALKRTKNPVSDNKERNSWLQVCMAGSMMSVPSYA